MTILNPSGKSDKDRSRILGLLIFIMVVFGILAFKFTTNQTFDEHSVIDDLNGLVYAFDALSYGDIEGFFDGVLESMVVIGLFVVIFTLLHFLFTTALKDLFSKKIGTILSLSITVYAFIDHTIYNYLISLNAFAVGFFVFCAFVIMIWGLGNHGYKNLKQSQLELKKAKDIARQQYSTKGFVDGDVMRHIKQLQRDINDGKRKYQKDLADQEKSFSN